MNQLSIAEICGVIRASRKKIVLVALATALLVFLAVYFLVPARYQVQTKFELRSPAVDFDRLSIVMRSEILPQVYREMELDQRGLSKYRVDRDFVMYYEQGVRHLWLANFVFISDDPELAADFLNRLTLETLIYIRDRHLIYLQARVGECRQRITEIDALLEDEALAYYYSALFQQWSNLRDDGTYEDVFLEFDPYVRELYLEKQSLFKQIEDYERSYSNMLSMDAEDFSINFTPAYPPDTPGLLLVGLASAILGLLVGTFWVLFQHYGLAKYQDKSSS